MTLVRAASPKLALDLPVYDPTKRTATAKPSKLARDVDKHAAKVTRRKVKAQQDRDDAKVQTAIRRAVFERDHSTSRASGQPVKWADENPAKVGHRHHILFRSRGGSDELSNLVLLTEAEHEMAHGRGSKFVLDIYGDANQTLRFVKRHLETGQVVKEWESACPS